jgi:hypothetical protein
MLMLSRDYAADASAPNSSFGQPMQQRQFHICPLPNASRVDHPNSSKSPIRIPQIGIVSPKYDTRLADQQLEYRMTEVKQT